MVEHVHPVQLPFPVNARATTRDRHVIRHCQLTIAIRIHVKMAGLVSHFLLAITAIVHQDFQEMNARSPFHLIIVRPPRVKTAEVASKHLTNKTHTDVTVYKVFLAGIVKVGSPYKRL